MIKRLILSVSLFCAVFSVRADTTHDVASDVSQIMSVVSEFIPYIEDIGLIADDILRSVNDPNSINFWHQLFLKIQPITTQLNDLYTLLQSLSTDLLSLYYQTQLIQQNTHDSAQAVNNILSQLSGFSDFMGNLGSFLDDYDSNIQSLFSKLDSMMNQARNAADDNSEQLAAIIQLLEDMHDLFYAEGNIRELLEAIQDQRMYVEFIYSFLDNTLGNWLSHADEYFFNPFYTSYMQPWSVSFDSVRMSGFSFPTSFPLTDLYTYDGGGNSGQGDILNDISDCLHGMINGEAAMCQNLLFICSGVYEIVSNLCQQVDLQEEQRKWYQEYSDRSASAQQDYSSLLGYEDKFYTYKSPEIIHIHDTIRGHINETFSPFVVNDLPAGNLSLFGFSGFGDSGVDHVNGVMDMESFGSFFVAARFCFGFLYWILNCVFVWWCLSVAIKMYKMTLNWFTALPQQVG